MKKADIRRTLKNVLNDLSSVQMNYEEYSKEADEEITKASDRITEAIEVL